MGKNIKEKLTIKEIPIADRPYEKFEKLGAKNLTEAELLAMIIKSGNRDLNCVEIAKLILGKHENGLSGFSYIDESSIDELMKIPGIGKVKAMQLKAVLELAKRISSERLNNVRTKIKCPKDVYDMLYLDMQDIKVEQVKVVLMDTKSYVKSVVTVSKGAANKSAISAKEILSEPIKQLSTRIILVHNHPSGDTTPSRQDILLTRKLIDYASLFDITLVDHIIIGLSGYTSIKETNSDIFIGGKII